VILDSLKRKCQGLVAAVVTRGWMGMLDYQAADYDPTTDPVLPRFQGPCLFVFWHEYIPFMFYLRGRCRVAFLVSQHRDAEWVTQAARHMGFQTIKGSTTRGGVAALLRILKNRIPNLAITPDGPRGPRRTMAPGAVYLASRLGIPLVPVGLGYARPWRVRDSWDQFAIPRPYSRARAVFGPRLVFPGGLSRDELDAECRHVGAMLNRLTETAEHWADCGCHLAQQRPLRREGIPLDRRHSWAA